MEFLGKGAYAKVFGKDGIVYKISSYENEANREFQALKKLQFSDYVVTCYDHYIADKFYVLELEEGVSLKNIEFQENKLKPLFHFALQVLKDLESVKCHHNDIKAPNIIWCKGKFKLIDFGIASFGEDPPKWDLFTPGIKPFDGFSKSADIWSMGITIIAYIMNKKTSTKFRDGLPKTKYGIDVKSLNLPISNKYIKILQQMTLFNPQLRYKVLTL